MTDMDPVMMTGRGLTVTLELRTNRDLITLTNTAINQESCESQQPELSTGTEAAARTSNSGYNSNISNDRTCAYDSG